MTDHNFITGFLAGIIFLSLFMAAANGYRWGETHGLIRYECRAAQ